MKLYIADFLTDEVYMHYASECTILENGDLEVELYCDSKYTYTYGYYCFTLDILSANQALEDFFSANLTLY